MVELWYLIGNLKGCSAENPSTDREGEAIFLLKSTFRSTVSSILLVFLEDGFFKGGFVGEYFSRMVGFSGVGF